MSAFSDAPASRSVPSSVLGEAAAVYNDEWHAKLSQVPGRAAHLRLVFDDDVSLLYWHKVHRFDRAGLELDAELVPTQAQPLGVCGLDGYLDTDYLNHSSFDPESELVRAHVGEHLGVYKVRRMPKMLPFELAARPADLARHRQSAASGAADPPQAGQAPAAPARRTHDSAPHISTELALVLRTLRIFIECVDELDHRADSGGGGGTAFFSRAEWDALAHEVASLEWVHLWLHELADGRYDAVRRLLDEPSVARAQAEVECGWRNAGKDDEGSSVKAPPTVEQLQERNRRAWGRAWELFEAFVRVVQTPGHPRKAHSRFL
ncbi:uncharacterized protein RHOBADRAFT_47100 [Rhodotorula graminis WP1]|uniref:Uncharacterized protein n=1 Tax=Rhodotorula graminis (strain WP1) TaxID=578459 RepID=A0A0P9ESG9_RHOGW|nr:uncharacterized protein RHOBADRAFT_47100 [Rhodotorula graminis WP1]KPV72256.1 hypothetical protein RHOBADRAFT_47100 [Rhodotorula graminis WP1]